MHGRKVDAHVANPESVRLQGRQLGLELLAGIACMVAAGVRVRVKVGLKQEPG